MDELTKEKFMLIYESGRYRKHLKEAIEAIQTAIENCKNPAVCFSFGKDSLVCLDIAAKIKPDILIINIDRGKGGDIEEAVKMYDEYAKERNLNYHRVKTPKEIFEIYKEAGSIEKLSRKNIRANLLRGIKKAREIYNIDCEIIGLRAEESRGRSYLNRYGTFHYSENEKIYKCKPVLHWKDDEIWAHIVGNNLPYTSWYDKEAEFDSYEKARYSNWAGLFLINKGRFARLRKNYPKEFQELATAFPEVKHYV